MMYNRLPLLVLALAIASTAAFGAVATYRQPAGLGAGPAVQLRGLTGVNFDRQYIRSMYQQFSDISALATQGISKGTSKDIRDLSGKIRDEQTKKNEKLALWGQQLGVGRMQVNYGRVNRLQNNLSRYHGHQFDVQYARTMIGLLEQSRNAANLGMTRATMPEMRDQAKITVKSATNEINALNGWLNRVPVR